VTIFADHSPPSDPEDSGPDSSAVKTDRRRATKPAVYRAVAKPLRVFEELMRPAAWARTGRDTSPLPHDAFFTRRVTTCEGTQDTSLGDKGLEFLCGL